MAAVLRNRGNATQPILVRFSNLQIDGKTAAVRDVWAKAELGNATGQLTYDVAPHDVKLLVLTPFDDDADGERLDDARWAASWKGHGIRVPASRAASVALAKAERAKRGM